MEDSRNSTRESTRALVAVLVGFVLGAIAAWIYWMGRDRRAELPQREAIEGERVPLEPVVKAEIPEPAVEAEAEPDDLTRVEGIGPKMSSVLRGAGIETFEELAETEPNRLRQLLREERLQFADPTTWPEQAALAAAGAWADLEALQEKLSGGRRVG